MYKVFVNDNPLIVTNSLKNENDFPVINYQDINIESLINQLQDNKLKGVILFSTNVTAIWKEIIRKIPIISAAGGLVQNANQEVLFIKRFDKWDLPKGKIESGEKKKEAAIREVEEECGISNLIIKKYLTTTYHVYTYKGKHVLKESFWYLMHTNYQGKLTPQLEEDITSAVFKNKKEALLALENTYANIKLVYELYLKNDTLS